MDVNFWHKKWNNNEIAFHQDSFHPFLENNFNEFFGKVNSRILVPLCGKTLDISWLLSQKYYVVAIELHENAILQLFEQLNIKPKISNLNNVTQYSGENIDVFVGNFFDITDEMIGTIDGVYDRAALVALPYEMRSKYAHHLMHISNNAAQFLISFEYDQNLMSGPPFSVNSLEITNHYQGIYNDINCKISTKIENFKGKYNVLEKLWLIHNEI